MRRPAARVKPRIAKTASFPAPVGGLIKNINLATPGARLPDGSAVNGAAVLENWLPTATGARMRGGSALHNVVGDASLPVISLFTYVNGNNAKLFAATANAIYDVTVSALPDYLVTNFNDNLVDDAANLFVAYNAPAPSPLTGVMNGGDWIAEQIATPGGVFLRIVNGIDTPYVYDGTTFSTSPAITGPDPSTFSYVWAFKQRLFFIKKDSLSAYYLPAASIGGAAVELPLGGVFTRGGSLLFGATWSTDTGAGLSEQCVFVTTEGEVAVYQGTDPSVAASWTKVGIYKIGKPLGPRAWIRAGGDLVIATNVGFVPLSQAVQRDIAALSPSAISYRIETEWNDSVDERSSNAWNCEVWPAKQMVVVALPPVANLKAKMLMANARTGAWGTYTGWDAYCVKVFKDRMFYGGSLGRVIECEVTGADLGAPYTASVMPLFDPLKSPASLKIGQLARAQLLAPTEVVPKISLQVDFDTQLPSPPDDYGATSDNAWGSGIWGTSVWGTQAAKKAFQKWQSIGGRGYAIAPAAQITSGGSVPPDIELVQFDMTYDVGDVVS